MGERGLQIKADINKEGWEASDFPLVCETCLGDNPYVRMTKEPFGKACKICDRPFTIFRWRPGAKARFKKTEVCQTCAKMKNVCQTCVLDLTYGLPVQVRDQLLEEAGGAGGITAMTVPQSDTNKQWFAGQHDRMVAEGHAESYGKAQVNEKLLRLARQRQTPYYKRNLPHKCSFYAKGECTRGDRCPFLHEMPTQRDDPLAQQNIKDRFYGQDDPVAQKLLRKASAQEAAGRGPPVPPEDATITTLMVGGMDETVEEADLRDHFYSFGEIASVRMVRKQGLAFVEYTTRGAAEAAAKTLYDSLSVRGLKLRLSWANRPAGPPPGAPPTAYGAGAASAGGGAGAAAAAAGGPGGVGSGTFAPGTHAYVPPAPMPGRGPAGGGGALPLPPPQIMGFVPAPPPPQWTPGTVPPPPPMAPQGAPGGGYRGGPPRPYYPSMDPQRMGARPPPPPGQGRPQHHHQQQQQQRR